MKKLFVSTASLLLAAATAQAQTDELARPLDRAPASMQAPSPNPSDRALIAHPLPKSTAVDARQVRRVMAQPNTTVIDVRTPEEYAAGHLADARNVDFRSPNFAEQIAKLDKNRQYVLYCKSGSRSSKAAAQMRQQGFKKVVDGGGYDALKAAGAK